MLAMLSKFLIMIHVEKSISPERRYIHTTEIKFPHNIMSPYNVKHTQRVEIDATTPSGVTTCRLEAPHYHDFLLLCIHEDSRREVRQGREESQ